MRVMSGWVSGCCIGSELAQFRPGLGKLYLSEQCYHKYKNQAISISSSGQTPHYHDTRVQEAITHAITGYNGLVLVGILVIEISYNCRLKQSVT